MKNNSLHRAYIAQFYRGNGFAFLLAMVSTVLLGGINLSLVWLLQQVIDAAGGWGDADSLSQLIMTAFGILAGIIFTKMLRYCSKPRFIQRAIGQYKRYAFQQLTRKSIASFTQEATSVYLSAFSNDIASIEANYLEPLFSLIYNVVLIFGAMGLMLFYSPLLTGISLSMFLLPVGASVLAGNRMEVMERTVSSRNESFLATLKDTLTGFPVVKGFGAEQAMSNLFQKSNDILEREKCEKRKLTELLSMIGGVASVSAQFGTILIGIFLMNAGYSITPGILIVFLDLTANAITPVNELPDLMARRKAARGLIKKMAGTLDRSIREEGQDIPLELKRGIEFQNVSFGYGGDEDVLKEVSVRFEPGKVYAIVGASGSGKSTLLNLMMGSSSDYTGAICYDDHEQRTISGQSLYSLVNMIQQNVFVFQDTLRNNITLFQSFPGEAVERAVVRSGLDELIREKGEDYLCSENGSNLSGGEKQRLSIARSLLREAPVLLADEATASLDKKTAELVMASILELDGLTRIVVTHSLEEALLKRFDCVVVMKKGRIVETGRFEALMERKKDFYALYTTAQ